MPQRLSASPRRLRNTARRRPPFRSGYACAPQRPTPRWSLLHTPPASSGFAARNPEPCRSRSERSPRPGLRIRWRSFVTIPPYPMISCWRQAVATSVTPFTAEPTVADRRGDPPTIAAHFTPQGGSVLSASQEIVLGTFRHHCAAMCSCVPACRNRRQLHRSRRRCRQAQGRILTRLRHELAALDAGQPGSAVVPAADRSRPRCPHPHRPDAHRRRLRLGGSNAACGASSSPPEPTPPARAPGYQRPTQRPRWATLRPRRGRGTRPREPSPGSQTRAASRTARTLTVATPTRIAPICSERQQIPRNPGKKGKMAWMCWARLR
jgi:hypothetical protein